MIVTDGSAGFSDVLNAALVSTLDVIAEGEECIRAESYVIVLSKPSLLLFSCEYLRLNLEDVLPCTFSENVLVLVRNVYVDSVVSVGTADVVNELETKYLRALSEPPVISLVTCESCSVDS